MSNTTQMLRTLSGEIVDLVTRASQATVSIGGKTQRPATGTIVAPDLVVAIDHVIDADEEAVIEIRRHDGDSFEGRLAGRDATHDVALIRVPDLQGVPLATASELPSVGALLLSVSRTWQGRPAASLGLVGAVGGPLGVGRGARIESVIRADVASTPGISGSPLVNVSGELVGIVNAGIARGVPLALPAPLVTRVVQTLAQHGRIRRGYLGVGLQPVSLPERQRSGATRERGLLLVSVQADSPADRAGLLVGDVIVTAGDEATTRLDELHRWLGGDRIGTPLTLEVLRGGQLTSVDVTVGERAH
jgi:S1-C subfamily serine protease